MKPEDRSRLEEIRGAATRNPEVSDDRLFELLRIIDEQAAEIARLETQSENQARIIDTQRRLAQCGESKFEAENETLKEQLAEERAKLRCQKERFMWRHAAEKERADRAERELAEERANSRGVERLRASHYELEGIVCRRDKELEEAVERAEKAEALREQAETALLNGKTRVDCCCFEGAHKRWAERAKKAEAHAKELEAEKLALESRVAELQALVDAATTFEFDGPGGTFYADTWYTDKPVEVWCVFDVAENGLPQNVKSDLARDEAIALARDLAAKEKEPT